MKNFIKYIYVIIFILGFTYCSDYTSTVAPVETRGIHPEGWSNKQSVDFHGDYLAANNFDAELCKTCHGADFSGGTTEQSCSECHMVHPKEFSDSTSVLPHFEFMRENGYPLNDCKFCHASDYSGGNTGVACTQCHTSAEGPEACNTCHGDFNDVAKPYPPRAVNGSKDPSYAGVGAHIHHLTDSELSNAVECKDCHIVPNSYKDAGHIDSTPGAELNFSLFASSDGSATYDKQLNKCSNVYCHGNFAFPKDSAGTNAWIYTGDFIEGENFSPKWTQLDETQAECGTCHLLPPNGHQNAGNDPSASTCSGCHFAVVDASGNIIDPAKHINGQKNVFGN